MLAYSATSGATTNTFAPLTDVLGSTLGLVNSSGSLATQYTYEPFGVPTASGQSSNYPYLFAGMEYDTATGLYHTPARYYSPRLQRFLSEDPLQFAGGDVNLFGYAGNDPVNLSDPSGEFVALAALVSEQAIQGAVLGGIFGAASYYATHPHAGWLQIAGAGAMGGAVGFVTGAYTAPAILERVMGPLLSRLAWSGVVSGLGSVAGQLVGGGPVSPGQTALAVGFGGLGAGVGQGYLGLARRADDISIPEAALYSQALGGVFSGFLYTSFRVLIAQPFGGLAASQGGTAPIGPGGEGDIGNGLSADQANALLGGQPDTTVGSIGYATGANVGVFGDVGNM